MIADSFSNPFVQFDATVAMLVFFRTTALVIGAFLLYLGYSLFKLGYFEKAGELQAAWGQRRLVLKQVAPGIFFALFGTAIVCLGIWKPIAIQSADPTPEPIVQVMEKIASNQQVSEADRTAIGVWLQRRRGETRFLALDPFGFRRPEGNI
ncbi:hypothetical protein QRQ56_26485 [Bradyrhizobium sp. U531]|uniref:hypothetical protein n=1 Tax=Bradyrhizobium sp. U531 TaxID=3053458 RepID=UPI003F43041F